MKSRLPKHCDYCNEGFTPTSKYNKICIRCAKKAAKKSVMERIMKNIQELKGGELK